MQIPTTLSFVRHGHVHNPDNVFYGRLPGFGLSDHGHREAQWAGRVLQGKPIAALVSSPLLRAKQTARVILTFQQHVRLRISKLLTEVFSAFEGLPSEEIRRRNDDIYTGINSQFEQPADVLKRAYAFIMRIRRAYPGQHVVAVTHGDIITFMMLHAGGVPVTPENKLNLLALGMPDRYPATGSITTFTYRTHSQNEKPEVSYQKPL